ncbi:hypothetical protein ACIQOF_07240 [Streptomyces sp. NPDC091265]|uniref:hypothetical protein n=1 Tax=unclassified Streptomyces TaxID=2593676 RepID=UPI003450235D
MFERTLSHHFKTLRDAGVIATHREGAAALNVLQEDELDQEEELTAPFPGLLDAILARRG